MVLLLGSLKDIGLPLVLHGCSFTDKNVFKTVLDVLKRYIESVSANAEILFCRLVFPRLYQDEKRSDLEKPLAVEVAANQLALIDFLGQLDFSTLLRLFGQFDLNDSFAPVITNILENVREGMYPLLLRWIEEGLSSDPSALTEEEQAKWTELQAKRRSLREAVSLFNRKPRLGLDFAVNSGLIRDSMEERASFLLNTRGLNKTVLGEFLSEADQSELYQAYLNRVSFEGDDLVEALRSFLQLFRLPGEAQRIDRIVEGFARRYCDCCDWKGKPDLIYQLAFMVVMLNTDLHSVQVKDKMAFPAFLQNCRSLDPDLEESWLRGIYEAVAQKEIVLADSFILVPNERMEADRTVTCSPLLLLRILCAALSKALTSAEDKSLDLIRRLIPFFLQRGFEPDSKALLEAVLKGKGLDPAWLYDLIEDSHGQLGSLWTPTLAHLSRLPLTAVVDEHHNIREINLNMDPASLMSFLQALLPGDAEAFQRHYGDRLQGLSSMVLEHLLTYSYGEEDRTGLFSVLGKAFLVESLRQPAFLVTCRLCQEQISLLATGKERALSEFTQILIQFGLDNDPAVAEEAIGMFRFVADLLFTQQVKSGVAKVDREAFLLRWNPVISGLAHVAVHQDNVVICGNAIRMAFEIVRQQGVVYDGEQWRRIFRGLFLATIEDLSMQRGRIATELIVTSLNWIIEIVSDYAPIILADPDTMALWRTWLLIGSL